MNEGLYYQFAEIEDNHWWFLGRRQLIKEMFFKTGKNHFEKALDIGCGVGGNVNFLKSFCTGVTGLDYSGTAINLAKKKWPLYKFLQGDANNLSSIYPENSFDLVTILNVMYHKWISNDGDFLKQTFKITKQGGFVVITEPAFMHLWREHDVQDMGKKRYTLKKMKDLLEKAGFTMVFGSYFNSISYIPVLLMAMVYRFKGNKTLNKEKEGVSEIQMPNKFINKLMYNLLKAESEFIKIMGKMPVGVSCICIAKKI